MIAIDQHGRVIASVEHPGSECYPATMRGVPKPLLYLAIFFVTRWLAGVLISAFILPHADHEAWWMATVIALGFVGAIYTIIASNREMT